MQQTKSNKTREDYMQNCIFWIREYKQGGVDKETALSGVLQLSQYCTEIITELKDNATDTNTTID